MIVVQIKHERLSCRLLIWRTYDNAVGIRIPTTEETCSGVTDSPHCFTFTSVMSNDQSVTPDFGILRPALSLSQVT